MCGPLAIAAFAVSALSSVAQFNGEQAAADAQDRRWVENYYNSVDAARNDYAAIIDRTAQEQEKTADELAAIDIENAQAASSIRAASGGSGASGISLDSMIADVERQGASRWVNTKRNFAMTLDQLEREKTGVFNTTQSRINSEPKGQHPSGLSLFTNIASAGVRAFS